MAAKRIVGLLFGGRSGEHEVSIRSAAAIAAALAAGENVARYEVLPIYIQKDGLWQGSELARQVLASGQPMEASGRPWQFPAEVAQIEVWFPIVHGPNGEDGSLQGLLQLMQVPFVGSDVLGSAVGMDKLAMKSAFAQAGLPQVAHVETSRDRLRSQPSVLPELCAEVEATLGYPCFVKPANLGSSVGIAKVRTRAELETALDDAASYDRRIVIEAGAADIREVECAVLGGDRPQASVIGEIRYDADFYDYETKYTEGRAELLIPAPLPETVVTRLQEMAIAAFAAVGAAGLARVDFFYQESSDNIFINEINTLPGFTATSMYPQLWGATGVDFPTLVDRLIALALAD